MHNRALVMSPDGSSAVQDITASSNSYKFYVPKIPSNDDVYDLFPPVPRRATSDGSYGHPVNAA